MTKTLPPEPAPALMLELEDRARELLTRNDNDPAFAAYWVVSELGIPDAGHVAIDLAERIRR
jgi:hypothetical protein